MNRPHEAHVECNGEAEMRLDFTTAFNELDLSRAMTDASAIEASEPHDAPRPPEYHPPLRASGARYTAAWRRCRARFR